MKPWYFAHATSDFDTPFEQIMVERLEATFMIENPNQPRHQEGYALKGMDHFLKDVLPNCFGCIFMTLPTGHITAGVAAEVEYFLKHKLPVFQALDFERPLEPIKELQERRILTPIESRGAVKILRSLGNGGRGYV